MFFFQHPQQNLLTRVGVPGSGRDCSRQVILGTLNDLLRRADIRGAMTTEFHGFSRPSAQSRAAPTSEATRVACIDALTALLQDRGISDAATAAYCSSSVFLRSHPTGRAEMVTTRAPYEDDDKGEDNCGGGLSPCAVALGVSVEAVADSAWAVRNAGTRLFAAVSQRIVGTRL